MSSSVPDGFYWNGEVLETHSDILRAVREICRLHAEGHDVTMLALEFIDDYGTYLDHILESDDDGRKVARDNIGWMAGDQPAKLAATMFEVFECEHPLSGTRTNLTPEEALEIGKQWATGWKERRSAEVTDTPTGIGK